LREERGGREGRRREERGKEGGGEARTGNEIERKKSLDAGKD